jgi:hypothetical protein
MRGRCGGLLGVASILVTLGTLSGCNGCREETVTLRLAAPYNGYFNARPAQTYNPMQPAVAARSNNGLTDSYQGAAVARENYPEPLSYNCTQYQAESRRLDYASALYGYHFTFSVVQYRDGPMLVVDDYSRDNNGSTRFRYHFNTGESEPIEHRDPTQLLVTSGLRAEVSELPMLTVGGRSYAPVWRLRNPYQQQYGRPTAATMLYLSPEYGLIRFEQRDGTVWDLTP